MTPLTCSVAEAAEILGIGRDRVYGLIHSHQLPAIRAGRSFRIPRSVLQDLVQRWAEDELVIK